MKSNRLVRGTVAVTNTAEPGGFTQRVELVNRFEILAFHGLNVFDVAADPDLISSKVMVVKGSLDGVHDGVYRVTSALKLEWGVCRLTVAHGQFLHVERASGYLIQARELRVVHGLNADPVHCALRNELDVILIGCYQQL